MPVSILLAIALLSGGCCCSAKSLPESVPKSSCCQTQEQENTSSKKDLPCSPEACLCKKNQIQASDFFKLTPEIQVFTATLIEANFSAANNLISERIILERPPPNLSQGLYILYQNFRY